VKISVIGNGLWKIGRQKDWIGNGQTSNLPEEKDFFLFTDRDIIGDGLYLSVYAIV
jgi:hypothetical protein